MQYISQPLTSSLTGGSEERKISTFVSGDREPAAKTYCRPSDCLKTLFINIFTKLTNNQMFNS